MHTVLCTTIEYNTHCLLGRVFQFGPACDTVTPLSKLHTKVTFARLFEDHISSYYGYMNSCRCIVVELCVAWMGQVDSVAWRD
jgi:hypothetical protein